MRAYLPLIGIAFFASANSQIPSATSIPNPTLPNGFNQDIEQRQRIQEVNEQRARDQANMSPEVAKFMSAIKPRKGLFPDFDQVVLHGNAPMTMSLLGLISQSPYAADIAYYLGKHPDESGSIAHMQPDQARAAVKEIEVAAAAKNPISK